MNELQLIIKITETVDDIITNIIDTRVEKGLTQGEVAEMAGINERTLIKFENSECFPRIDTIVRVVTALGLKLEIR